MADSTHHTISGERLDDILHQTVFSDLNTHIGGCTSVAVGIGRVVEHDGFVLATDEEQQVIHAFVVVDGQLFDAEGMQYEEVEDIVRMIHAYNPFDKDRYKPRHFPLQNLPTAEAVDEHLFDEYVRQHETETEMPFSEELAAEVVNRVECVMGI